MKQKIITILSLSLFMIGIIGSKFVYAATGNLLLNNAFVQSSDGAIRVIQRSSWVVDYIDLSSYSSGTITFTFDSNTYAYFLFSAEDIPSDIEVGYVFISDDYRNPGASATYTLSFTNSKYVYISRASSRSYSYTINSSDPTPSISPSPSPEVTPTLSPTPVPENPGSNIPYHFDIPLDYYFVVIIILLGGVLICQFFKK